MYKFALLALLFSVPAQAQMMGSLVEYRGTEYQKDKLCQDAGDSVKSLFRAGRVVNRQTDGYAITNGYIYGAVERIERITALRVAEYSTTPGQPMLRVCRGTLVMENGKMVQGVFTLQFTGMQWISTWGTN